MSGLEALWERTEPKRRFTVSDTPGAGSVDPWQFLGTSPIPNRNHVPWLDEFMTNYDGKMRFLLEKMLLNKEIQEVMRGDQYHFQQGPKRQLHPPTSDEWSQYNRMPNLPYHYRPRM